jgi:prepilin signal peptidase PulO-like enzyme (type II secretory pathway)
MLYLVIFFSFLFGLIIGSFINCVVYRLHANQSFSKGRSHCPKCHSQIAWYDNLPLISYLLLRGHCRSCRQPIAFQYPLVEFISGLLFVLVSLKIYPLINLGAVSVFYFFGYCLFSAIFLFIFIYDLKYYLIPDTVTLPAIFLALVFNIILYFFVPSSLGFWHYLAGYLLGAIVGGGFFLLQFVISKGKWIGGGDIRLGFLIGLLLGWPYVLVAFSIAYITGALLGIVLIITKKKNMHSAIPFGTFLTASSFVTLLYGSWILEKYLSLTF